MLSKVKVTKVTARGVSAPGGGVCSRGCLLRGGGVCSGRVYAPQGGVCSSGACGGVGVGGGGDGYLPWGRVSALGGVCSQQVSAPGVSWGHLPLGGWGLGVSASGGVCSQGGCLLLGGVCCRGGVHLVPGGVPGEALPPGDRHTPVNILSSPKLRLRAVIKTVTVKSQSM